MPAATKIRKEAWWNWDGSTNFAPHWRANAEVVDDFGDLTSVHRCAICRCWLLADVENFQVRSRKATGHIESYMTWCRPCMNRRRREQKAAQSPEEKHAEYRRVYERIQKDPERVARRRERNRRVQERWRQTPGYREARRRYLEKVKKDPARRKRALEAQRLAYRLKREKEGKTVNGVDKLPVGPVRGRTLFRIVAMPVVEVLLPQAEAFAATLMKGGKQQNDNAQRRQHEERFLETFGVDSRTFFGWKSGERKHAQFDSIDRVLATCDLNWFDVFQPPPNGHATGCSRDVLKYIADAEEYFKAVEAFTGELTLDYV